MVSGPDLSPTWRLDLSHCPEPTIAHSRLGFFLKSGSVCLNFLHTISSPKIFFHSRQNWIFGFCMQVGFLTNRSVQLSLSLSRCVCVSLSLSPSLSFSLSPSLSASHVMSPLHLDVFPLPFTINSRPLEDSPEVSPGKNTKTITLI